MASGRPSLASVSAPLSRLRATGVSARAAAAAGGAQASSGKEGKVEEEGEEEEGALQVELGRGTGLRVSRLGCGTLQWGDPRSGFGTAYGEQDLQAAMTTLLQAGINLFDTAEVYGYQGLKAGTQSEQLLGRFETERGSSSGAEAGAGQLPIVIATKFFTIPWTNLLVGGGVRLGRQSLLAALRESLKRLGRAKVDLYQIHFPFPTFSNAALCEGLAEAVGEGLTGAVGVSNYSTAQMVEAHALLAAKGIPLASNQIRYSLVCRTPETDSLVSASRDLGVSLLAYSPLATGLLTDKARAATPGPATKVQPLLDLLASIGEGHQGSTVSEVALAYLMAQGAIPIPGCKSVQHAQSHGRAMRLSLSPSEVLALQETAAAVS